MLHNSKYQRIELDTAAKVLKNTWTEATEGLTNEEYKTEIMAWMNCVRSNPMPNIFTDTREFNFSIIPEVQEWNAKLLFPEIINLGVKKWALLVSPNIFSQVSIEQTMGETDNTQKGQFRELYFEDEREALKWFAS